MGNNKSRIAFLLTLLATSTLQQGSAPAQGRQGAAAASGCTPGGQRRGARTMTMAVLRAATPFQNNDGNCPPAGSFPGPFFVLNHAWPQQPLPPLENPPWRAAIGNGRITPANAAAYADALRAAVAPVARRLITDHQHWDAAAAHWYNEPWLGSRRDSISGTYAAGDFLPDVFPGTGLRTEFTTHVLTYYDERAAQALRNVWGGTAMTPTLGRDSAQFPEGSIIVKVALFASANPAMQLNWWDALAGAAVWPLFGPPAPLPPPGQPGPPPRVWAGYVAQMDIIVKDSASAPDTGWVFTTLVYDGRLPGDAWDRMIPLGAQWGNDAQAARAGLPLTQNWINPAAPLYSTQTLGWGGQLSGPNDGARNGIAYGGSATHDGTVVQNAPDSSCMSCHSTAQWNVAAHRIPTFLLPTAPAGPNATPCGDNGRPNPSGNYICSPVPGSAPWMMWFQNRLGNQPMNAGAIATDFDMVFAFQSLPLWWAAVGPANQPMPLLLRAPNATRGRNLYTGAPLPRR